MSRSDNTMPRPLQREDRPWARFDQLGGAYAHIGRLARYAEKSARQRTRLALRRGEEPEPTRHRGQAKNAYY